MKNPLELVQSAQANNEPVFVLRGRDRFAYMAVGYYMNKVTKDDTIPVIFKKEMIKIAADFRHYAELNETKKPD